MTNEKIKRMFDAFYQAKRIRDMLPPLPQGVMPSYIQYLDVIQKLERQKGDVKVSDISDVMELPRPGVTRTVKEMEAKGYLRKTSSKEDGRITYITITQAGAGLSDKYDRKYYGELAPYFEEVPEKDAEITIRTLRNVDQVMSERRINLE